MLTNSFSSETDLEIKDYEASTHEGHTGNPVSTSIRQVNHRLRTIATSSAETTRNVVQQSADHLSTEDALIVLARRNPKSEARKVQRQRKKLRNEPEIPINSQFEIPEEIQSMPNGENFVLDDWLEKQESNRIFLMGKNFQFLT